MSAGIRVLVVDDHPLWRDAVARDLADAGCEVVATAADGAAAIRRAAATRPEVALVDLQLPRVSGIEVTRALTAADPPARVLVRSASGERQDVLDAIRAGATGYLVKSASREELLDAVRRTAAGEPVFTPGLAATLAALAFALPDRPQFVLALLVAGHCTLAGSVALRRPNLVVAIPGWLCAAWLSWVHAAVAGQLQWRTLPAGLALLAMAALRRGVLRRAGRPANTTDVVALEVTGMLLAVAPA